MYTHCTKRATKTIKVSNIYHTSQSPSRRQAVVTPLPNHSVAPRRPRCLVGAPAALRLLLPGAEPREPLLQRLHVQSVLHVDADDAEARHLVQRVEWNDKESAIDIV